MTSFREIEINGLENGQLDLFVGLLTEAGYSGFEELEEGHTLKAFIDTEAFDEPLLKKLLAPYNISYRQKKLTSKTGMHSGSLILNRWLWTILW